MLQLSDLITGIRSQIAQNSDLNTALGSNITYGIVPQQVSGANTVTPYCAIYTVDDEAIGAFGSAFLDSVYLQFSIWTTTLSQTSELIYELGTYLNNTSLTLTENTLVSFRRSQSIRAAYEGQDKVEKFLYAGHVIFKVTVSGC